ncbi:putative histidine phosphatase family protein [Paenibacillus sp. 598K]|uniref:histidine phosphatase family protein n=1 Tax=Paenibacillus sp. 598K TaxID=1117987 RepID=UPI000FFA6F01|nr:histidine phosphatase family protein [Paenibacillus sp. 598K]GBF75243.1 putative histidine phosphatase family protein [Paenibacillus sp. 598K]
MSEQMNVQVDEQRNEQRNEQRGEQQGEQRNEQRNEQQGEQQNEQQNEPTPPTRIYIVRHGQTEWNVEHRFQGHQDSPLTALGVQQAEWLAEALREKRIDAIYASTSTRAFRTAEIIRGKRELPIHAREGLKEINLGVWEGGIQQELEAAEPERYEAFWNDPETFRVEGGETFTEVVARASAVLDEILERHAGETVLISTHTVVLKLLMARFEGRALRDLWQLPYIYPACLCLVEGSHPDFNIVLHGDTSHYRETPVEG